MGRRGEIKHIRDVLSNLLDRIDAGEMAPLQEESVRYDYCPRCGCMTLHTDGVFCSNRKCKTGDELVEQEEAKRVAERREVEQQLGRKPVPGGIRVKPEE